MRYEETTHGIRVNVQPIYMDDHSEPDEGRWVWAYEIEIENRSDATAQLRDRTWTITDATGHVDHVHGPGVVGEQPILNPGDAFRYSSGCPLKTPSGFMAGFYTFVGEDGGTFDVTVPAFALDLPGADPALN